MNLTHRKPGPPCCWPALAAGLLASLSAQAQQFAAPSTVIAAGGGGSAGGNFALVATIGQAVPGRQTGGNFTLEAGFIPTITVLQTPGAPTLSLNRATGTVILNWAVTSVAFTLESTMTPHVSSSWLAVAGLPTLISGTNYLSVPVATTHQFYRLKSQ